MMAAPFMTIPEDPQLRIRFLREMKMNGLVRADEEILRRIDTTAISLPVTFQKDGSLRKSASIASGEEFRLLGNYVKEKIRCCIEEIQSGNAVVSPYEMKERTACTYCSFASVCGFDRKIPGFSTRRLQAFTRDEIWEKLKSAEKQSGRDQGDDQKCRS